jgi:hypothetical protein
MVRRYTRIDEFHKFKASRRICTGTRDTDGRSSLRLYVAGVRTDAAFDESIEELWSGRVRSGGSYLHPHRQ